MAEDGTPSAPSQTFIVAADRLAPLEREWLRPVRDLLEMLGGLSSPRNPFLCVSRGLRFCYSSHAHGCDGHDCSYGIVLLLNGYCSYNIDHSPKPHSNLF